MLHDSIFKNKITNFEKLLAFGFIKTNQTYIYSQSIVDEQFMLTVIISNDGNIKTKVTDTASEDEYILHLTDAVGTFIGKVRNDYINLLQKIADNCFETSIFKSTYANEIIRYVRKKFDNEFEFLWEKLSDNAIVRRQDNKKWYAMLLTVSKDKIGLTGDEKIEVIDLRMTPEEIAAVTDNKKYFPGYHMNKKHWITICLDGSLPLEEIFQRIDQSYMLTYLK